MRFQGSDSGDRETAKRLRVLDRSNASVSSEFDRKDHSTEGRSKNSSAGARISGSMDHLEILKKRTSPLPSSGLLFWWRSGSRVIVKNELLRLN